MLAQKFSSESEGEERDENEWSNVAEAQSVASNVVNFARNVLNFARNVQRKDSTTKYNHG